LEGKQASFSRLINPVQAIFGMLWGVWYGGITRDVLSSTSISFTLLPLGVVKFLYVFSSPILLGLIVYLIISVQTAVYRFPTVWDKSFREGWHQTLDLGKKSFLFLIPLWGFLTTTYVVFQDQLDSYLVIFGAWHPIIWLSLEAWLVWSSNDQEEGEV
jgi:hypothetical protein